MEELWNTLNSALLVTQFLAALVGCFYFFKLKGSHWKWFSVYLVIIFIQELFWIKTTIFPLEIRSQYYLFFGMPIQFLFFYWLYAQKSLNNKNIYLLFSILLIVTLLFTSSIAKVNTAYGLVLNVATLLLIILVIIEFLKQIRNDDILKFKENKMFYINLGVVLFYFGSFPFHVFQKYLYKDYTIFIEYYYVYFLLSNCIMYLLFTASFIWGKQQS